MSEEPATAGTMPWVNDHPPWQKRKNPKFS